MRLPEKSVVMHCIQLCSDRFESMVAAGVDEQVALDRTYDCYEKAMEDGPEHCFDSRDRLFENRLRTILREG